jgi:hypothetical protein
LAEVDLLGDDLSHGLVEPAKALSRLWSLCEDELQLRRETGLFQQVVELGGKETLADVARFGMVTMVFRTHDGRYGKVVKRQGEYVFAVSDDAQEERLIETVVTSLKRGIRVGHFTLPNFLPNVQGG